MKSLIPELMQYGYEPSDVGEMAVRSRLPETFRSKASDVENRLNHANCPDSEKLKELGWSCEYSIKQGFRQVMDFFREQG